MLKWRRKRTRKKYRKKKRKKKKKKKVRFEKEKDLSFPSRAGIDLWSRMASINGANGDLFNSAGFSS